MQNRVRTRLTIAAAAMLLATGCAPQPAESSERSAEAEAAVETIRISGPAGPPSLPLLRMIETAALGDTELVFERWETADQLVTGVTEGIDFAAAPLTTGAVLAAQGAEIRLANVSAWDVSGLVTTDTQIAEIEDLAGKTIHVAMQASAVDYTMQLILEEHGLGDEVTIDYVDPLNGPEQLLAGQIDTLVTVEPQLTLMLANSPDARSVVDFQAEWETITQSNAPLPTAGTFVNRQFAERHPDLVEQFVAAYAEAASWIEQHPAEAAELAASQLGLPSPILEAAIPKMSWAPQPAAKVQDDVMLYYETLYANWPDSIGGQLMAEDFFVK
ncbi:MAG: ABC transporter substrate-binding protein [Yaniella sp.]|uniref:ABC transporter substrate-binding protein n=1 Tax=Yaniella sp. TaxID=2773929 RepID=UPI0026491B6F|nr:ABC transporter substrate-binding protein [Yaniella sp.]MDN6758269.1 ABC transporter substrate-binding protein [Yaniella sp.]